MNNIAVVEDDDKYRELIKSYILRFAKETEMEITINDYQDGLDIVNNYKPVFDVIILDIQMRHLDGIEAARKIREYDKDVILIFVTNMVQFALKGYEVNAYDFIPKPINYATFSMTMFKVKRLLDKKEDKYLTFPIKGGVARVSADEVKYIEVMNHHLYCHLKDGVERLTSTTLSKLEEKLKDCDFIRVSNSYLVNMRHVTSIQGNSIYIGDEIIAISRSRKKLVLSTLTAYIQGGL